MFFLYSLSHCCCCLMTMAVLFYESLTSRFRFSQQVPNWVTNNVSNTFREPSRRIITRWKRWLTLCVAWAGVTFLLYTKKAITASRWVLYISCTYTMPTHLLRHSSNVAQYLNVFKSLHNISLSWIKDMMMLMPNNNNNNDRVGCHP